MANILPAILTDNYKVFEQRIRAAEQFADMLQIDIADGDFVPTRSITAADIESVRPAIPFEIHLMVQNPEDIITQYLMVGAQRVIVHKSASHNIRSVIQTIRQNNTEAALAVSPATITDDISELVPLVQQVTFVAVQPGFQGGALIPGVLQKARAFKQDYSSVPVEIDGGIKEATLHQALETGADRIVIGSGVWEAADPAAAFQHLVQRSSS